ncbi:hypothetical protein ACH5RR_038769 [Cinchona calisaya]|uniref:Uncharacterized protein n=1 Tax=Cinchona calisaya TaxID=153742 RepID=A0ABD2XYS6_9GENT
MGSSDSLQFPSEPPDIGKLFSSYVYESPELNSIDDFKDSGPPGLAEIEPKKEKEVNFDENGILEGGHDVLIADGKDTSDGFCNCKSIARNDNCTIEVLNNSDSLSLSSEPPDVKNWFSSYAYESPAIDTNYEFRSHPNEDKFDEEENDAPNCSTGKEEELTKATKKVRKNDLEGQKISGALVKCTKSDGEKEWEHHNFTKDSPKIDGNNNSAVLNDSTPQRLSHHILQLEHMQGQGKGSAEEFELSIPNGENPFHALNFKFAAEASHVLLNIKSGSGSKTGNLPQTTIQSRDPTKESDKPTDFTKVTDTIPHSENLDYFNLVNRKTENKAICGHDNKENDAKGFAESGFVSTRSKKRDDENSFTGSLESKSYHSRNEITVPPRGNKEATATRKVLQETTNVQAPNLFEITGKWRCPQKSKPNLGPPLKQLRLEQWVRRV